MIYLRRNQLLIYPGLAIEHNIVPALIGSVLGFLKRVMNPLMRAGAHRRVD